MFTGVLKNSKAFKLPSRFEYDLTIASTVAVAVVVVVFVVDLAVVLVDVVDDDVVAKIVGLTVTSLPR